MRNSTENAKGKKRQGALSVLVLLSALTVILLFLEITLRTTHLFGARPSWTKPDPLLGYRFAPGSRYWFFEENDRPVEGRINNFGWRDNDWTIQKPEGKYRISFLGDSYVEAFQVELDSTFHKLVETKLGDELKGEVETMSFGRSGFTQTEELLVLKKDVMRFSPDVVVLLFLPRNDIEDVSKETALNIHRPFFTLSEDGSLVLDTSFRRLTAYRIRSITNFFQRRSALVALVAERYRLYGVRRSKAIKRASRNDAPGKIGGYLSLCTDSPDAAFARNYDLNKALIKRMADYCRGEGVEFILVCIDNKSYKIEKEREYKSLDPSFDGYFFERDLSTLAESLDIPFLGLQSEFRAFVEKTGVSLHWSHWNYQGHEVVGNALTRKLSQALKAP